MAKTMSPNRRRSIAVLNQTGTVHQRHKRRAHSITPGETLSPRARARRLVPRKSILRTLAQGDEDDTTTSLSAGPSRKSLGRRVSFAAHAHVRYYARSPKSSGRPSFAPNNEDDPLDSSPESAQPAVVNDENAYPGARPSNGSRRRSSLGLPSQGRTSLPGADEMSMDVDDDGGSPLMEERPRFSMANGASALDSSDEEDDHDDMDVTTGPGQNMARRRSRANRRRSSLAAPALRADDPDAADNSTSSVGDMSLSSHTSSAGDVSISSAGSGADQSSLVEMTVPIAKPLQPSKPPSEAWQALRAMTHSGDAPEEPSDDDAAVDLVLGGDGQPAAFPVRNDSGMELGDALTRLRNARDSMGFALGDYPEPHNFLDGSPAHPQAGGEASFSSNESFTSERMDEGNMTMNVTALMSRQSLGRRQSLGAGRMSMGNETAMSLDDTFQGQGGLYPDLRHLQENESLQSQADPSMPGALGNSTSSAVVSPPPDAGQLNGHYPNLPEPVPRTSPAVFHAPGRNTRADGQAAPDVSTPSVFTARARSESAQPFSRPASAMGSSSVFSLPGRGPQNQLPTSARATSLPPSPSKSPGRRRQTSADPPSSAQKARVPPFVFTPRSNAVSSTPAANARSGQNQKSTFSAAFAPPSARKEPGSVRQRVNSLQQQTETPKPNGISGTRRPSLGRQSSNSNLAEARKEKEAQPASTPQPGRRSLSPEKQASMSVLSSSMSGIENAGPRRPSVGRAADVPVFTASERPASPILSATGAATASEEPVNEPIAIRDDSANRPTTPTVSPLTHGRPSFPSNPLRRSVPPSPGVWASSPGKAMRPPSPTKPRASMAGRSALGSSVAAIEGFGPSANNNLPLGTSVAGRSPPGTPVNSRPNVTPIFTEPDSSTMQIDNVSMIDERGPMSVDDFLHVTDIKFFDDVAAPRRSTFHAPRASLGSSTSDGERRTGMEEYAIALAIDVPQLELYHNAGKELSTMIEKSRDEIQRSNEEARKVTPQLFEEYLDADEDGKSDLLHQLKQIKRYTHEAAKSTWYEWKAEYVEQLTVTAQQAKDNIETDCGTLSAFIERTQAAMPVLQEEYDAVMRELEEEQVAVAEIDKCDQSHLDELKASIKEQSAAIEGFDATVREREAKLQRWNEKVAETRTLTQENQRACTEAQKLLDHGKRSMVAEMNQVKSDLEFLQDLHMWRVAQLRSDYLELVYDERFRVSVPCAGFQPLPDMVQIVRLPETVPKRKDWYPPFNDFALEAAQVRLEKASGMLRRPRDIVRFLSDHWNSCGQLRKQMQLMAISHVHEARVSQFDSDGNADFNLIVKLLLPNLKAKVSVSFVLDVEAVCTWPASFEQLRMDAVVNYGPVKGDNILRTIVDYLQRNPPTTNLACFADACQQAIALCQ